MQLQGEAAFCSRVEFVYALLGETRQQQMVLLPVQLLPCQQMQQQPVQQQGLQQSPPRLGRLVMQASI